MGATDTSQARNWGAILATPFAHLVPISNLPLSQSSPSTTLQATEQPFTEPLHQFPAGPPAFTPVPIVNPFSTAQVRDLYKKPRGHAPTSYPQQGKPSSVSHFSSVRPKLSLRSTRPLEDLACLSSHSPELARPSSTLFYFLIYARFPFTLLSTTHSAWSLSPTPFPTSPPDLINLYLASSWYFSSSGEAVPTLTIRAKSSSLPP